MKSTQLHRLETDIERLTLFEQMWLLERLVKHIRAKAAHQAHLLDSQLQAMAQDPDIQRELAQIQAEFAETEMDGLNDNP